MVMTVDRLLLHNARIGAQKLFHLSAEPFRECSKGNRRYFYISVAAFPLFRYLEGKTNDVQLEKRLKGPR